MLVALRSPVRLNSAPRRDFLAPFPFLKKRFTPRTVFMEIGGAPNGEMSSLALRAAGYVERVYVVDVSGQLLHNVLVPCNVRLVLCDGVRIPVPEASVHVAWGGAFMDDLQPDGAREHLESVRRSLVPGGEYICVSTQSGRARRRLLEAGFSAVSYWLGPSRIPWAAQALVPKQLVRVSATK